jgi:MFS family permease
MSICRRPVSGALPGPIGRQSGEQIALAAAPILAVLAFGAGAGETGLLQTALTLPFLLGAIPAGLMVDHMPRRQLMAAAEVLRAVCLFIVLPLIQMQALTWPLLALLGFLAICANVVFSVAAPALVRDLVTDRELAVANARVELARTTAFAGGPALGGLLVGWAGPIAAFGVAAIFSTLAAVLLSGIQEPARRPPARRHPLADIKAGAVFVLAHPMLRPVFVTQFASTRHFSCSLRPSCPMRSAISACRPPARGSRSRCLALAWWWGPCTPLDCCASSPTGRAADGAYDLAADGSLRRSWFLPAWCRTDPVGHQHNDAATNRNPT